MPSRDIYFLNVPERAGRRWEEFRGGGYLSTVGCARALDALSELAPGDILAAYLRRCGYVGVGIVLAGVQPVPAAESEYALPVYWLRTVDREDACWLRRRGLFASPQIKASLMQQPATLRYLQNVFDIGLSIAAASPCGTTLTILPSGSARWPPAGTPVPRRTARPSAAATG
jgi:hypothetical protein